MSRSNKIAQSRFAPVLEVKPGGLDRDPALVSGADDAVVTGPRPRPVRVLIADGQVLVRAGLRAVFEREADIAVVAEATDGAETVALAEEMRPDVVLIDIGLQGIDTLELTRRIRADSEVGRPEVMILAAQTDDERLFAALRAGASGFLLKDTDATGLVQAVRGVAAGDALLSPSITRRLIAEVTAHPDPKRPNPTQFEDLTAREREVVTLVAAGLSNQEIAERLVVSPATAKTHVSRALYKVHARDRAQLVALAYEAGLVTPRRYGAFNAAFNAGFNAASSGTSNGPPRGGRSASRVSALVVA